MTTRRSATLPKNATRRTGRSVGGIDVRDLHLRSVRGRGVTLSVRRSVLVDFATSELSYGRRTGFF